MLKLQQFTTQVIEALGGVVEPVEYALCQVMIPEEHQEIFQGKTELELSFDFEVFQENPQSEFITLGSYYLEQLIEVAREKAISAIRFVEVDRLKLANAQEKIKLFLNCPGEVKIIKEEKTLGAWAAFNFRVTYIFEEKWESTEKVWLDLVQGKVDPEIGLKNEVLFCQPHIDYKFPFIGGFDIPSTLEKSYNYIQEKAEEKRLQQVNTLELNRELERIKSYYNELKAENERKLQRKGINEKRKNDLEAKTKSIELELAKQVEEMKNKYYGRVEFNLDHGLIYFIPMLSYQVETNLRGTRKETTLNYNLLLKKFS